MIVQRKLGLKLIELLKSFPVVTVTGCRQCGKSTLLKNILPDYQYVSLEDIDIRQIAQDDPRHFLSVYNKKVIMSTTFLCQQLKSLCKPHGRKPYLFSRIYLV